jgi:hypothetical protein
MDSYNHEPSLSLPIYQSPINGNKCPPYSKCVVAQDTQQKYADTRYHQYRYLKYKDLLQYRYQTNDVTQFSQPYNNQRMMNKSHTEDFFKSSGICYHK